MFCVKSSDENNESKKRKRNTHVLSPAWMKTCYLYNDHDTGEGVRPSFWEVGYHCMQGGEGIEFQVSVGLSIIGFIDRSQHTCYS